MHDTDFPVMQVCGVHSIQPVLPISEVWDNRQQLIENGFILETLHYMQWQRCNTC